MKCNNCGAENPEGTRLCLNCGLELNRNGLPKWAPYVIIAAICVAAVVVAFFFAASSNSGGSAVSSSSTVAEEPASAYLAAKDGKVVIYKSDSAEPYQITDVSVSDLGADDQEMLGEHPKFDTVEEAQVKVGELREGVETAKKAAEEQAIREAEERARAEAEAQAQAAAEAQAAAAAAKSAAQLPEGGAQPFWGVWIGAFREIDNARNYVSQARSAGFNAAMYETTDWENLNSDHYYVVSLGEFASQAEAEAVLPSARSAGFSDAYVKYTGSRK